VFSHLVPTFFALAPFSLAGQVNVPVNGPHERARPVEAFTRATVHPSPGVVWANATLLIQGDRILAVGQDVKIPAGAIEHDLSGLHLWPALIEPYSDLVCRRERNRSPTATAARIIGTRPSDRRGMPPTTSTPTKRRPPNCASRVSEL
jgi:hypothetical protein